MIIVVKYWNRETMDALSLKMFKVRLDGGL